MAQLVEALHYKPEGRGFEPIPVAELCKARVYDRSLDEIAESNPAGGMDACVVFCK
jgi:hypothetical protein